jgi:hypothetical protein
MLLNTMIPRMKISTLIRTTVAHYSGRRQAVRADRRPGARGTACALLLAVLACSDAPPARPADGPPDVEQGAAPVAFAPQLEIDLQAMTETGSGLYIQDVSTGRGTAAQPGHTVVYEYRAWLPDGTLFEQRPSDEGFGAPELILGEVQPYGLNEAIEGMRPGGVRRVVLPPEHGYGLIGRPAGVPAGATLVFEVRLRSVRGQPAG